MVGTCSNKRKIEKKAKENCTKEVEIVERRGSKDGIDEEMRRCRDVSKEGALE